MRILPNISYGSLLGENLGKAVGGSLAGGLEALAEHKMGQIVNQKTAGGIAALKDTNGNPLFSPQESSALAALSPQERGQYVKQRLQQPSQEAFAQSLQSILGGDKQQPQRQVLPKQQMSEGEILGQKIFGNNPPQIQQQMQRQQGIQIPANLNPQQAIQLAQLGLQKQNLTRKEEIARNMFEKKESAKIQALANKETLPYFNEVSKEEKSAKKIDLLTDRMIHLIDKGKLPDPVWYKQLKDLEELASPLKSIGAGAATGGAALAALGPLGTAAGGAVGAAIGGLLGLASSMQISKQRGQLLKNFPDTEEFEKLSAEFISGAKAIFGSRVTDNDLKAFMQTVPQLINTEHGKRSIIRNIQTLNDATHARYEAMKEVIKENGGNRPVDLSVQVEERADKKLDELANKFIKGI